MLFRSGEREMASDNKSLGRFELMGIPPAPRGVPQVEVTFDIDANGILNVSAKDLGSGKEQAIKITAKSGLSEDEINQMVKDAESHAEDDKKRRDEVMARNNLDNLAYQTEKLVRDNEKDISAEDKKKAEDLVAKARKAIEANAALAELKDLESELTSISHSLSSSLYEKQKNSGGAGQGGGAQASADSNDEDVIDADYKETD